MAVSIGKTTDLGPGEMRAYDVEGTPVAVANVDGSFYAFDDICPHEHCSLAEGELEGTTVTCPCHGSQFDVRSGMVLNPPARTPLRTYGVTAADGELSVES